MQREANAGQTVNAAPAWQAANPDYKSAALATIDPLGFAGQPEPEDADSFIQLAEEGKPGMLRAAFRRYWRWDYRGSELREKVRRDCPRVTLEEFNAAADAAWAEG